MSSSIRSESGCVRHVAPLSLVLLGMSRERIRAEFLGEEKFQKGITNSFSFLPRQPACANRNSAFPATGSVFADGPESARGKKAFSASEFSFASANSARPD